MQTNPYVESVDPLTTGFVKIFEPSAKALKQQLKELTDKQETLLEQIHNENLSLSDVQYSSDLIEMFNKAKVYQNKLIAVKKDMKALHEKSTKLKKRSLKLQSLINQQQEVAAKVATP